MKHMKRLLVDASHVLKACLHSAVKGENAKKVEDQILPSAVDGYEIWLTSLRKTLRELKMVPAQVVFVKDGYNSKALRREFLPGYKERPAGVPGFHDEFLKMQQMAEDNLVSYGAIAVDKDVVEADDLIAALAAEIPHVIWSGDKDLLAAGDVYYNGELNPDKFFGIAKKHIVVYKSLVGDNSDKIPGASGLGDKAFIDMVAKFGDDSLDEMLEMFEKRTLQDLAPYVDDFKPFQKILDSEEQVYASYNCARFHHPGWEGLNWRAGYPKGDGTFPEWDFKVQLIEKAKLTPEFLAKLKTQIVESPWGAGYDIESWQDEESLDWGHRNSKKKNKPVLDVYGSHMAGFSLTTGPNNNWVYYFPIEHKDTDNISLEDMKMILNALSENKPTFVHNAEFELPVTRKHVELRFDRGWLPNVADTLIMKSYVNENTLLGLKFCTQEYLGYQQVTYEQVLGIEPIKKEFEYSEEGSEEAEAEEVEEVIPDDRQMNTLTGAEVLSYGADDSICTMALANLFSLVMAYEQTWKAFTMCELETAYMFAEGFLCGQRFDMAMLDTLEKENQKKSEELWEKINEKLIALEWVDGDPLSGVEIPMKLPGCVFEPAYDFSAAELKKVYLQINGEPLKCSARKVEKLAEAMAPTQPELAAALFKEGEDGKIVLTDDIGEYNFVGERMFVPKPTLNLGSPKQMCYLLYDAMKFPIRLRGKITDKMRADGKTTGNPKGNESAIRHAIMHDATEEQKELLLLLIEAKGLQTDRSLYLVPYRQMPNPKDGVVHPSQGQSRTTSRRMAPRQPNIAQVSKKSDIRAVYVPFDADMVWWSFDFSGQELRLTAFRSQCPDMLACYPKDGSPSKDVHSMVGVKVAELSNEFYTYDEFVSIIKSDDHPDKKKLKEYRSAGKRQVFGSVYGQTEIGLAEKLLIPVERAREIVEANDAAFPGVCKWKTDTRERLLRDGFATTLLGARRHLVLTGTLKDDHELRSGINFEIQGPAGEQTKLVISKFWNRRVFDRYNAIFHFPVHDQVCGCVTKEDCVEFIKEAHRIMTEPFATMDLPVESSIEIGKNFKAVHEIGTTFDEEKIKEVIRGL